MTTQPPSQLNDNDLELLSAYLDNQVSAAEREQIEIRLEREPALRRALEELRTTVYLLRELPSIPPPRSFTIRPEQVRRGWISVAAWLRFGSALAAVLLALTVTFDLLGGSGRLARAPAGGAQPQMAARAGTPAPAAPNAAEETGAPAAPAAPFAAAETPTTAAGAAVPAPTAAPEGAQPLAEATAPTSAPFPTPAPKGAQAESNTPMLQAAPAGSPEPPAAADSVTAAGSSSPGTRELLPQPPAAAPSQPAVAPIRLIEVSLGALVLLLGLGALVVARRRRR